MASVEQKEWPRLTILIVSGILLIIACVVICVLSIPSWAQWATQNDKLPAKIGLIVIAILPPTWLWYEYCFIWRDETYKDSRPCLEQFKYGQEVSRNIWLAFVGLIVALYFQ